MTGLLTVFKCKIKDEEVAKACSDLLLRVLDGHPPPSTSVTASNHIDSRSMLLNSITHSQSHSTASSRKSSALTLINQTGKAACTIADYRNDDGKSWEYEAVHLAARALGHMCSGSTNSLLPKRPVSPPEVEFDTKDVVDSCNIVNAASQRVVQNSTVVPKNSSSWSKHTPKSISSLLLLIELISVLPKMMTEFTLYEEVRNVLHSLLLIMPVKNSDLSRRIERLLSKIHSFSSSSAAAAAAAITTSNTTGVSSVPEGPIIGNDEPTPPTAPISSATSTAVTSTAIIDTAATAVLSSAQTLPFFPSLSTRCVISSRPSSKEFFISTSTTTPTASININSTTSSTSTTTGSAMGGVVTKIAMAGKASSLQSINTLLYWLLLKTFRFIPFKVNV